MSRLSNRLLTIAAAISLSFLSNMLVVGPASAHVKWFCVFNVAEQPVGLKQVLCPTFGMLTGLSILGLLTGSILEPTPVGTDILRALDRATRWLAKTSK